MMSKRLHSLFEETVETLDSRVKIKKLQKISFTSQKHKTFSHSQQLFHSKP